MHFNIKSILKSNRNYIPKQASEIKYKNKKNENLRL